MLRELKATQRLRLQPSENKAGKDASSPFSALLYSLFLLSEL